MVTAYLQDGSCEGKHNLTTNTAAYNLKLRQYKNRMYINIKDTDV
jgi:hypothetical protein